VDALLTPPGFVPLEGYGVVWPYDAAGGATYWLALVGGGLCPLRFTGTRVLVYACGSGIVGLLSSSGPAATPAAHAPVIAAELEGRVSLRLGGPFVVRAGLGLIVPFLRDPTGAMGDPYRLSVVAGTADLGLGVVF
jgi:hypothetical protein